MGTHSWNGHLIEVESHATPKLLWFGVAFSVRVDGAKFRSPDYFEGLRTVIPFEIADSGTVRRGRVESGHPCSVLHAVYRVYIEEEEVARGAVRARNWYITYGIIAAVVLGILAILKFR
jgi:hypothetical protein